MRIYSTEIYDSNSSTDLRFWETRKAAREYLRTCLRGRGRSGAWAELRVFDFAQLNKRVLCKALMGEYPGEGGALYETWRSQACGSCEYCRGEKTKQKWEDCAKRALTIERQANAA